MAKQRNGAFSQKKGSGKVDKQADIINRQKVARHFCQKRDEMRDNRIRNGTQVGAQA